MELPLEIIDVNIKNIDKEHICCAMSDKKGECQVSSKKSWLRNRFKEGLVFKKANVRGKVFIEYMPVENAWCPIEANDYMFINCFWVSGKYKGKGIGALLLEKCIEDSKTKNKKGLVILSSKTKKPYLSDKKYLLKKGFLVGDELNPYFQLLYLPFEDNIEVPKFKECVTKSTVEDMGFVLYYSNQCPFTVKYVSLLHNYAKDKDIKLKIIRYENKEEAQNATIPFTTYSLFYNKEFVTHEILTEKKFQDILYKVSKKPQN